jgi:TonB family protein
MIHHLTEDQIAIWFAGGVTAEERRHVEQCGTCGTKVRRFRETIGLFRTAVTARAGRRAALRPPSFAALRREHEPGILQSAARLSQSGFWPSYARLLSVGLHAVIVILLLLPVATVLPLSPTVTSVMMLTPPPAKLYFNAGAGKAAGGGGGGLQAPTPPSKGQLPKAAEQQFVPPAVELKNFTADLAVEATVVTSQIVNVALLPPLQFGDPNGVAGPPSAGPGQGGGIGTGAGTGVGPGTGPGVGPGDGGGLGGGVFSVGGAVSAPVLRQQIQPEYSDDGRKGRIQGTVELLIVVESDGSVRFDRLGRGLGYGLDQKAIEAVSKWRFLPGMKDGVAVATYVTVLVNFTLR